MHQRGRGARPPPLRASQRSLGTATILDKIDPARRAAPPRWLSRRQAARERHLRSHAAFPHGIAGSGATPDRKTPPRKRMDGKPGVNRRRADL